jgi:hypothetical protein
LKSTLTNGEKNVTASNQTLIEKLKAERFTDTNEVLDKFNAGIDAAIAVVREHFSEPPQEGVERVAKAIGVADADYHGVRSHVPMFHEEYMSKLRLLAHAAIAAYQQAILQEPGHD